jgi:metal-sulfur cluster biosynthetic enzyme
MTLINENPTVYNKSDIDTVEYNWDDSVTDPIIDLEIFELIRNIQDPEHPHSLEALNVVQPGLISINSREIKVRFTPTIPHCSMATLIGLCIRVRLLRSLSPKYKIDIQVTEGTHASEHAGILDLLIYS